MSEWMLDWILDWMSDGMTDWTSDKMSDWMSERMSDWISNPMSNLMSDRIVEWDVGSDVRMDVGSERDKKILMSSSMRCLPNASKDPDIYYFCQKHGKIEHCCCKNFCIALRPMFMKFLV